MKIDAHHPDYDKHVDQWTRCSDAFEGSDAVKGKGEKYLPKLPGQSPDEYNAYLLRAVFFGASQRTLDLFTGLVFSKSTKYEGIKDDDPLMLDADLGGNSFDDLAEDALEEVIGIGRYGVLVDFAGVIDPGSSILDAARAGARPYVATYEAADITYWHTASVQFKKTLDHVVLQESYEDDTGKAATQLRELILDASGYRSEVWRQEKNQQTGALTWMIQPDLESIPLMSGSRLDFIPFFFLNPEGGDPKPEEPPLLNLVDVNLSHYRTEADLEHALYHCGLPTPWAVGVQDDFVFALGGQNGLIATSSEAKFGYLEYTGSGVDPLEKRLAQKEAWMAKLGSDRLSDDKMAAETAQTANIRKSGEAATLASMVQAVSGQLTKVLKLLVEWSGADPSGISVQLNTEYLPASIDAPTIVALLQAVQSGDFRRVDFLSLLKVGGKLAQDADVEEIDAELGDQSAGTLAIGLKMAAAAGKAAAAKQAPEGSLLPDDPANSDLADAGAGA